MNITKKTYVRCLFPGSFLSEEQDISLEKFQTNGVPEGCFAYQIFEVEIKSAQVDGEQFSKSKHTAIGGRVYPGGKLYTAEQIRAEFSGQGYDILLENMRGNDWPVVVLTRRGNWQPFEEGDKIE